MTISPFTPLGSIGLLTKVSAFTHRDNATFLRILAEIVQYINETLSPEMGNKLDETLEAFNAKVDQFNSVVTTTRSEWQALFDDFIADVTAQLAGLNDQSVADNINNVLTETAKALAAKLPYVNVKDYGAKGDGVTDDTNAIKAAIDAVPVGGTVYFPPARSSYLITSGLTITKPNITFATGNKDYASSIKCVVPGVTMLTVKETQFVNEMTFIGNANGAGGIGASVNGIDLYGDINSNNDSVIGGTFIHLNVPLRIRGRNADVNGALFSNSLAGVVVDGVVAGYHTATTGNADKRGTQIRNSRFHDVQDKAIELTPTACVLSALIEDNFFDSGSPTRAIYAVGTAALPHRKLSIRGNKITESSADSITLVYVQNSAIRGTDIAGWGVGTGGVGMTLDYCTDVDISDAFILQTGRTGIVSTNGVRIRLDNIKIRAIGYDAATVADGFNFNTTNSGCEFTNLSVEGTDGYGFNGDPATSSLTDSRFNGCTLGNVNSTTVHNRAASGRNVYVEGIGGRKEDYACKSFDPVDGVGFAFASTTPANSYTSYEIEVTVIGRTNAGPLYYKGTRYVRLENGAQVVTTIGTDVVLGTVAVNYTPGGNIISLGSTVTGAGAFATYHVKARAGAGNTSVAARGVTVAMA